jgi:hypothetical protein
MSLLRRPVFYLLVLFLITGQSFLFSQSITFDIEDFEGVWRWFPAYGPVMFSVFGSNYYAWTGFDWNDPLTVSYYNNSTGFEDLIEEEDEVTVYMSGFDLQSFGHINVVSPGEPIGDEELGDYRIYTNGYGSIELNGETVVVADNFQIEVLVHYPVIAGGPGDYSEAYGFGVINYGESDPVWAARLDNGFGQVVFDFISFEQVTEQFYDATVEVKGADINTLVASHVFEDEGTLNNVSIDFMDDLGLQFDFSFIVPETYMEDGEEVEAKKTLLANKIIADGGGELPEGVSIFFDDYYYKIGAVCESFEVAITFDLSDIPELPPDLNDIFVLKRPVNAAIDYIWDVVNVEDFEVVSVSPPRVKISNVTSFSEWGIGSEEYDPLPIELSSFTAAVNNDSNNAYVEVSWITETEANLLGFKIYRNTSSDLSEAKEISNSIIPGTNTSLTTEYIFFDEEVVTGVDYFYWLNSIDLDLTAVFYGPIAITLQEEEEVITPVYETALIRNYPNPFNPDTTIEYSLREETAVALQIYNLKGQLVKILVSGIQKAGKYEIFWDGLDSQGKETATGIYFYRLLTDHYDQMNKMMMMK